MLRRTPTTVVCRSGFRIVRTLCGALRRGGRRRAALFAWLLCPFLCGCYTLDLSLTKIHERIADHCEYVAARVSYPEAVDGEASPRLASTRQPRPILPPEPDDLRPLSMVEAIHLALSNSKFIRVDAEFLSLRGTLLNDAQRAASIFDVAIQDSSVLFGQRGPASALSDFQPQFRTNMLWRRDENVQNNLFQSGGLSPGDTLYQESGNFDSRIEKVFATGGSLALDMTWNYSLNNAPARLFGSAYTGTTSAEYRHPLWAGGGTEFTQIAGPVGRLTQSGVFQGILIARINRDITATEFENNVRNLVYDVQQVYWELQLSYREYETQRDIANGLEDIWKKVKALYKRGLEGGSASDEAQAADNYFQAKADAEQALATVYDTETRLRRLLRLPHDDGKLLHPIDSPATRKPRVDWAQALETALSCRLELRRQKLTIRSIGLQLKAARSLARPRLDFVSAYRVNAFGDGLYASNDGPPIPVGGGVTPEGFRSAFGTLFQGNQTGWDLGFQMTIPLGFRNEQAQVRNLELRLAKARAALAAQELDISHELRAALTGIERWHANLRNNKRRMEAAERRVKSFAAEHRAGRASLDLLLRAQISSGQARVTYFRALAELNKAIANLQLRAGMTLKGQGIQLLEGMPAETHPAQLRSDVSE